MSLQKTWIKPLDLCGFYLNNVFMDFVQDQSFLKKLCFIKNIVFFVSKMNRRIMGLEQHEDE